MAQQETTVNKVIPNINDINLDSINNKDDEYSFRLDNAILRPKPWAMVENKGDDKMPPLSVTSDSEEVSDREDDDSDNDSKASKDTKDKSDSEEDSKKDGRLSEEEQEDQDEEPKGEKEGNEDSGKDQDEAKEDDDKGSKKTGGGVELLEEQQGSSQSSKTDGKPEDDALKIQEDDQPPNEEADTTTPPPEEMMEALTQEVNEEEEEDAAAEQTNISRDQDQDVEAVKAPETAEDIIPDKPQDKKEKEPEESSTDEGTLEGDLRNRKKSRLEAESLSLPALTNLQTPGNGLTFSTPAPKEECSKEKSPAPAKGLIKSPSITKLAEKFEVAPSTSKIVRTTRVTHKGKSPEKLSPWKKQETPEKQDPTPSAIRSKRKAEVTTTCRILAMKLN